MRKGYRSAAETRIDIWHATTGYGRLRLMKRRSAKGKGRKAGKKAREVGPAEETLKKEVEASGGSGESTESIGVDRTLLQVEEKDCFLPEEAFQGTNFRRAPELHYSEVTEEKVREIMWNQGLPLVIR